MERADVPFPFSGGGGGGHLVTVPPGPPSCVSGAGGGGAGWGPRCLAGPSAIVSIGEPHAVPSRAFCVLLLLCFISALAALPVHLHARVDVGSPSDSCLWHRSFGRSVSRYTQHRQVHLVETVLRVDLPHHSSHRVRTPAVCEHLPAASPVT